MAWKSCLTKLTELISCFGISKTQLDYLIQEHDLPDRCLIEVYHIFFSLPKMIYLGKRKDCNSVHADMASHMHILDCVPGVFFKVHHIYIIFARSCLELSPFRHSCVWHHWDSSIIFKSSFHEGIGKALVVHFRNVVNKYFEHELSWSILSSLETLLDVMSMRNWWATQFIRKERQYSSFKRNTYHLIQTMAIFIQQPFYTPVLHLFLYLSVKSEYFSLTFSLP